MLAMLTTLMDISEAETGVMKLDRVPVDVSALAREALELYQHVADERGVRLDHASRARDDRQRRSQSSPSGARQPRRQRHQILARRRPGRAHHGTCGRLDRAHRRDTGVGISADDLPRIWERLYRADQSRSERGLGLGLSFVKAIVEAHGGTAEVRSEIGVGSTFVLRLPAAGPAS